jgi:TnpA family transposase
MARRPLLTDEEHQLLFGVPGDPDALARISWRAAAAPPIVWDLPCNWPCCAIPAWAWRIWRSRSIPLSHGLAAQLEIPAAAFSEYAGRPQTMTDHALLLARTLGLRPPNAADLPFMIEAAAQSARSTDRGQPIVAGVIAALRTAKIILPAPAVIERSAIAGRARARKRTADALLAGLSPAQLAKLDALLIPDPALKATPFAWLRNASTSPKPDHVRALLDRLRFVRDIGVPPEAAARIHDDRFQQLVREGRISDAHQIGHYVAHRRRAILVAAVLDLETRLTDAVLDMSDKLIGGLFARARKARERRYVAGTRNVARLMRLFHDTIEALGMAQNTERDAFTVVDETVGWTRLLRVQGEVKELADLAGEDPLQGAADRYLTLRKFAPELVEALEFKALRPHDPTLSAIRLLRDLNRSGKRTVPADAPMPFRQDWKRLISEQGQPNRRLYETAVFATLRDRLRSGDVWIERSSNYRRFDSYLLPAAAVSAIAAELGLPATADEWLAARGAELDRRLKCFARRLQRGELEGVELRDGRLHITPVKAATPPEAEALAGRIDVMLPSVRITEVLHEVNRATGFSAAFTNLRTGEPCDNENALLATILADATNLGLTRMAAASHGVTRDQLIWIADAYIRPETYKAALARIINAHHALPIAAIWGDGTTSSSDGQFFRSAKRGDAAGEINARYGHDPGLSLYTHLSDQHGPYNIKVMSATHHEAPYVLDGLLHHGTLLKIDTHYTDTGGASDHVFALCALLGFCFCPRLRDLPERKLACIAPASTYPHLQPLLGQRIKTEVIREHWGEIVRLVASLKAGTVAPSAMLRKLAAYRRQNKLDMALQEFGRIERTLFMLDWLESPELRRRCHAGLNKSEQRHSLAQVICTFKQGRIGDRGAEAQQFRASGLNLVIAAIVFWNSTYIADAVAHLRAIGEPAPDTWLAHTSPLSWEHISLSGDFLWDRAAATAGKRRTLNSGRVRIAA